MKPQLTPVQARVLGVLVEKQHTVPDTYPLSLNALVSGCNQKNARDPVMELAERDVQAALDELRPRLFVIESSGARVTRYSHNLGRVLKVPSQAEALLATLMLRGPQTTSELRANSERFHRFADASSVEAFLEELATRPDSQGGALVVRLARRPGEREARWAHLLSGEAALAEAERQGDPASAAAAPPANILTLQDEVTRLRADLVQLQAVVAQVQAELGRLRGRVEGSDAG